MVKVTFTAHLKRLIELPDSVEVDGSTVREVLNQLEGQFKGIRDYIVDEHGELRKHVNIFVGKRPIRDRKTLSDSVEQVDELYFMQALSGG